MPRRAFADRIRLKCWRTPQSTTQRTRSRTVYRCRGGDADEMKASMPRRKATPGEAQRRWKATDFAHVRRQQMPSDSKRRRRVGSFIAAPRERRQYISHAGAAAAGFAGDNSCERDDEAMMRRRRHVSTIGAGQTARQAARARWRRGVSWPPCGDVYAQHRPQQVRARFRWQQRTVLKRSAGGFLDWLDHSPAAKPHDRAGGEGDLVGGDWC